MPPSFSRIIVIVLDGVGAGALEDASDYGDAGSDTLGNIARAAGLRVPVLRTLGLDRLVDIGGTVSAKTPRAAIGRMAEASPGKDSVTGHWEMMGIVLDRAFPVFPNGFPKPLLDSFERQIGRGTLGNYAASGTQIIEELGAEHVRTGKPIVYTSADSVFQIAAHEDVIPIEEQYRISGIAFDLVVGGHGLGRVIARPFVGQPGSFSRTGNRKDFAMRPTAETVLDRLAAAQIPTIAIGKIDDLFAGRGLTRAVHTGSDDKGVDAVMAEMVSVPRGLIFANLVDFDTLYGHRNDAVGYAKNLERFDARLKDLLPRLRENDLLVITADHGNDPTTPSTDHSREHVPLLITGPRVKNGVNLGTRETFADLGQTVAENFGVGPMKHGTSFLHDLH
ncbi:MAG TPA: phosphopentomutase [Vicinamibacterales bacterium]|nr:phosphopentomutase [Vicinamibacterales bacterium]